MWNIPVMIATVGLTYKKAINPDLILIFFERVFYIISFIIVFQ